MRGLWSDRQNCSHNVSQKFKRIGSFSATKAYKIEGLPGLTLTGSCLGCWPQVLSVLGRPDLPDFAFQPRRGRLVPLKTTDQGISTGF